MDEELTVYLDTFAPYTLARSTQVERPRQLLV